ncbi:DUF116 domain-containing protein [Natronincola ferrireducens]|uniref:DUF116 domain-containing protein n=1 Tax=Natronincola ferrireducens TaxID=393762 RepID=A0A1G9BUD0_9FIRM|nr:DUF116 domain-containing protein [Natronincola ferrireducens]SDK42940.1 hypothetical protein SAMN05660472_01270 [Natronincola ferrireducens]
MEINKKIARDSSSKTFAILLIVMLMIVLALSGIIFWLSLKESTIFYQIIGFGSMIFLLIMGLSIGLTIFAVMMLWYNKRVPSMAITVMEIFIHASYPIIIALGKLLKYDKNTIRRAYTNLNNQLVLTRGYKFKGEDVLILTPHCIQKSSCPHKITNNIYNCKRCGLCNVDRLIDFKERYSINFSIVTGGTLARKMIQDLKPRAIIAIACERDLFSGLMDVKRIPILAIVNKRPEGPCINTQVDLKEVEKGILHFIKE